MTSIRLDFAFALRRLILIIPLVLFVPHDFCRFACAAAITQYNSRTWQTDEGLPHNVVQAITQTPDGYLWVGTREGLARFDGMRFTTFDSKNTPEIKNSTITALCADRTGALWIGSDGGGLVRFKDGVFLHYSKTNGLAGDNLRVIYESRDGSLWIGTSTGMSQFSHGTFVNYNTRYYSTRKTSLLSSIINSIDEDKDGNLWIATSGGLNRLRDDTIDAFTAANGLPNNSLRKVCQDKEGRLWIGSNSGIVSYESGAFHSYSTSQGLSDNFVTSICEDREGNLWAGTYGGLNRFVEGSFVSEVNNEGAPYDQVNIIFEDREGNIWVGSKEGLIQLTPRRFVAYTKRQGLNYNNIMSVMEDRNGSLWIGTWGGGLNQLKDGTFTAFNNAANGLANSLILSTCEGRDGSLWVGADFDGGLFRLKDGKSTHYSAKNGLIGSGLKVIREDQSGNLWIGTSRGLSCFKNGKFTNYTSTNSNLPGDSIRDICEDRAGRLWFGTEGGLSRWENGQFANFKTKEGLSDNVVNALYEDKEHNLWIGTDNGGLNRYNGSRFTSYTMQQGLFSDRILEILEDDHGWLWMSCYKGIFRVRKKDLDDVDQGRTDVVACIAYGKADGMESSQCNGVAKPAGWKARDGRLWFPTTKGLVVAEPNLKLNEIPPSVLIEEVIADRKKIDLQNLTATTQKANDRNANPAGNPFAITLPPGGGELEFHYAALSLSAPAKDRFKYKLEGIDSDWIDAGARRLAHYNNLYPGRYQFRVKAANNDSVWNETGATLALVLLPHIWQTKWFLSLTGLAGIGVVAGTVRYISWKKLRQKLARLEMQHSLEKERARIARDIHDDLGSSLTQITLLSDQFNNGEGRELQGNTRKISATAREMARSLDEIVWAINPEHDTLEGLVEYLTQSADEFLEDTPIRSRLKAPNVLPPCVIPADVRHDLFLAFKEALNNSVRHAQASEIQIEFLAEPARFQIIIADNGTGFDIASAQVGGNGLKNMRRRLETIGGQFELSSQPGQGTRIKMTIQLKENG